MMSPADPRHGRTAGYWQGCRCDDCRAAYRTYARQWQAERGARNKAAGLTFAGKPRRRPETRQFNLANLHRYVYASGFCWWWLKGLNDRGYAVVWVNGKNKKAHRAVYELLVRPIPPGFDLDHLCRNTACVNPDHMEPVTGKVNNERKAAVISHCPAGHPYSGENLVERSCGRRGCRECRRAASRRHKAKKRVQEFEEVS